MNFSVRNTQHLQMTSAENMVGLGCRSEVLIRRDKHRHALYCSCSEHRGHHWFAIVYYTRNMGDYYRGECVLGEGVANAITVYPEPTTGQSSAQEQG